MLKALCLALLLLSANLSVADDRTQVGSVEITNLTLDRYQRLATSVGETVPHGMISYYEAPRDTSFVVFWLELKLKPDRKDNGELETFIPSETMTVSTADDQRLSIVGQCARDGGLLENHFGLDDLYFRDPKKLTLAYSLVVLAPNATIELKVSLGTTSRLVMLPKKIEETIDRHAGFRFDVKEVKVLDQLTREYEFAGDDDDSPIVNLRHVGTSGRFLVVKVHFQGVAHGETDGKCTLNTNQFGVVYGQEVYAPSIGALLLDEEYFVPGNQSLESRQDAAGNFATEAVSLVFPLPKGATKFKLLFSMQPIAALDLPE